MNRPALQFLALAAAALVAGPALADTKTPVFPALPLAGVSGSGSYGGIASSAGVADLSINVGGIASWDAFGDGSNVTMEFNLAPGALVDAIAWNVDLTATSPSWLSELAVTFGNSSGQAVRLRPAIATADAGSGSFSGTASLVSAGLAFNLAADGKLFLQFHESFDDADNVIDGLWREGTLVFRSVSAVPEPGSYGLMALGLLGVAAAVRRRRA